MAEIKQRIAPSRIKKITMALAMTIIFNHFPFSRNLEKATVPIKARMPSSKIISKKAVVFSKIETMAVIPIKLIPIASSALTRSGIEGPLITRITKAK